MEVTVAAGPGEVTVRPDDGFVHERAWNINRERGGAFGLRRRRQRCRS